MRKTCLTAAAVLLLFAVCGWAQSNKDDANTRSVQGIVTSVGDKAVAGAIVQLKNTKTSQIRSFITQEQGTYYFYGLSTDVDYELRAEHEGSSSPTKVLSSFDSRKRAVINLKLNKK